MSGAASAGICALAGVALAFAGYALIRWSEPGPDVSTRFVRAFSPVTLAYGGGWLALFLGLLMIVMLAPMLYLRGG